MTDDRQQNIDDPKAEKSQTVAAKAVPNWKYLAHKIVWPLHARFPSFIPNPMGDNLEDFRKHDRKGNAESAIEDNVVLRLDCIIVSEIFGPNEIENLYVGLEKLGWDMEEPLVGDKSNIEWLKKQRLYGTEGRMPLGWISRPGETKRHFGNQYTADFPEEFSSLLITITQLSPSTTCLSVGFALTDRSSLEYSNAINEPAKSIYVPDRRFNGYWIKGVEQVKEARVARIRQSYRKLGIKWLSKQFPGYFSENCQHSHFPTTEILSLEGFTPFDKNAPREHGWGHWSRFVKIDHAFGSWVSTSVPSLRFKFDAGWKNELPNHITAALRCDTVSEKDASYFDRRSLTSRIYFASEQLDGIIARYALVSYIRELLRNIKETRQSLSMRSKGRIARNEVDQISEFFRCSIGVPSIAREVLALSTNDASFRWNVTGFRQQAGSGREETVEIHERLKSFLNRVSRQLLEEDQDTREFLNQLSSAMGIKESIAAQRRVEAIGWAALFVAVVSMVVASLSTFGGH
jgi:hypothetical protein